MVHQFVCFCLWLLGDVLLTQQQLPLPNLLKQISSPPTVNDETEMISVMEGDSVTLHTGEIQTSRLIMWTFRLNSSETVIVEIYKQSISIYDSGENEIFRDRLKIDEKTGSLTISNINRLHSGLYKLQVTNERVEHKSFNIAVYDILTVPVIIRDSSSSSSSNCSLVCSVLNVSHVTLSWYAGISVLSSISVCDLSISLSLPLEIQCLDDSYSCVVNNTIRNQTTHLDNITQLCQPCEESHQTPFLLVSLLMLMLLLLLVSVLVVFFYRRRKYTRAKQDAQSNEEEVDYTDATFIKHRAPDTEADGRDQTVYSEVALRR